MFELVIGSHFVDAGFEIEFRTNPDVYAQLDESIFLIEASAPSLRKV